MSAFFKGLALLLAVCCAVWVGMLWYWQSKQHDMSVRDVVVYLALLPLTLFALVLLGRWAWRGAAARSLTPAAPTTAAGGVAGGPAASQALAADEAARHLTCQLLAAHGNTPLGATPEDWAGASEAHKPAPALDDELRNDQGLPVQCARVADLDLAVLDEELEALLAVGAGGQEQIPLSESFRRALSLLREPLAQAVAELAPWAEQLTLPLTDAQDTRLRVLVAWPASALAHELETGARWLTDQLTQNSQGLVAAQRWVMQPVPQTVTLPATHHQASAVSGPELWLQADTLFESMRRESRQDLVLLLAAHSEISGDAVHRLESAGRLFSSAQPKGSMPGEAAVALLLAPAAWPANPDQEKSAPHLHRAAVAKRDKSIDAAGRTSHGLLMQLVEQALRGARMPASDIGLLGNDADQHTARGAELFAVMLEQLAHLDASEDMRMLGHLCGTSGACGMLMGVALVALNAQKTDKPGLALSLSDSNWRSALVVRPSLPTAPPLASSGAVKATAPAS
jgi:hypothetical protein